MGYMASVTIRNADLDAIGDDLDFGQKVMNAIAVMDAYSYRREISKESSVTSNRDIRNFELSRLREVGPEPEYTFWISRPMHADVETVHIIHDGVQRSPFPHKWDDYRDAELVAHALAGLGYRLKDVVSGEVFGKKPVAPRSSEDYMAKWDLEKLLAEGTTTLCILIDASDAIKTDKTLSKRLAQSIREFLEMYKGHCQAYDQGMITSHVSDYSTVYAGNHANPIQIACVTPPGETDIIVMGQNWARELRPFKSICQMRGDDNHLKHINKLMEGSHRALTNMMLQAGFQVRTPGRQRSESAFEWNRKNWPVRPVAEGPAEGCEP